MLFCYWINLFIFLFINMFFFITFNVYNVSSNRLCAFYYRNLYFIYVLFRNAMQNISNGHSKPKVTNILAIISQKGFGLEINDLR